MVLIPSLFNLRADLRIVLRIDISWRIGNSPMEHGNLLGFLMVPESLVYTTGTKLIHSELGHGAGHEAVDFVVQTLPGMIKASLKSAVGSTNTVSKSTIEEILVQCISGIDDHIKADLVDLFPGGPMQISKLTDYEIRNIITDPETDNSYVKVLRARTGTTALVALVDPLKSLYVASLGDCEASKHLECANEHI